MIALLSPGFAAVIVALIRGGSLDGLQRQRILWWPLGLAGFAIELALSSTPLGRQPAMLTWGSTLWMLALAATVAMLVRNARAHRSSACWAWSVAALGVAINLLVVGVNGGHMPQSQAARVVANASVERVAGLSSEPGWRNVAPMSDQTRLPWLGDVLPEPGWLPLHNVMSMGDLLLAGGLAGIVYLAARRGQPGGTHGQL